MGQYDTNNYIVKVELKDNMTDERWNSFFKIKPSLKDYNVIIKNNPIISSNPLAERIVRFFINYKDGALKPDRYDSSEPEKNIFDEANIAGPVSCLASPGGALFLKKKRKMSIEISNNAFSLIWVDGEFMEPQVAPPEYLTTIWVYFPKTKLTDLDFITQLMMDLKKEFNAEKGIVYYQATKEVIAEG